MDLWWEPRSVYRGTVPEALFGGASVAVDSVAELGAVPASRNAAANPMMRVDFMSVLL
jgi:hypothetical protein